MVKKTETKINTKKRCKGKSCLITILVLLLIILIVGTVSLLLGIGLIKEIGDGFKGWDGITIPPKAEWSRVIGNVCIFWVSEMIAEEI